MKEPQNSVINKSIETIDLATWLPSESEILLFDIKPFLYKDLILKEDDFRNALKQINWALYQNKFVMIQCSNSAIVPIWAYMLVASCLAPFVSYSSFSSNMNEFKSRLLIHLLSQCEISRFKNKRVVIKGCGDKSIGNEIYVALTIALTPIARAIMYGEPCSMVPIFKQSVDVQ